MPSLGFILTNRSYLSRCFDIGVLGRIKGSKWFLHYTDTPVREQIQQHAVCVTPRSLGHPTCSLLHFVLYQAGWRCPRDAALPHRFDIITQDLESCNVSLEGPTQLEKTDQHGSAREAREARQSDSSPLLFIFLSSSSSLPLPLFSSLQLYST